MEIDRPGQFRVHPIEWNVQEGKDSGSVGIAIRAEIVQYFEDEMKEWVDWSQYGMEATGLFNVIKKDGSINGQGLKSVATATGWNGDFNTLAPDSGFILNDCQFSIQEDSYNGKTRFKPAWINPWDANPERGLGSANPAKLRDLNNKFGGKIRAEVGNVVRNGGVAPGPGTPMPARQTAATPAPLKSLPTATVPADDLPF